MVKVETEVPAQWRKPPEALTPSTLDRLTSPRLNRFWQLSQANVAAKRGVVCGACQNHLSGGGLLGMVPWAAVGP